MIRALAPYSVPREMKHRVAFVAGVFSLPKVTPRGEATFAIAEGEAKRQVNNPLIGPAQLRERYNVTGLGTQAANSMAVAEFQGQYYSPSDLQQFFAKFVKNSKKDTVAGVIPPGSNNPSAPGVEVIFQNFFEQNQSNKIYHSFFFFFFFFFLAQFLCLCFILFLFQIGFA